MKLSAIVIFVLLFAGCRSNITGPQVSDNDELYEVAFRDLFFHNYSDFSFAMSDTLLKVFFIGFYPSIDSNGYHFGLPEDPSDYFLLRFSTMVPPVKKMSESTHDWAIPVTDKQTGLLGMILYLGPVTYTSDSSATIQGGWYHSSGDAGGMKLYLNRTNNRWWVLKSKVQWVT